MPSKALIAVAVIVVIAVLGAGFVVMQQPSPQQAPAPKPAPAPAPQPAPPPPPYVPPSGLKASLVIALNSPEIVLKNLTAANNAWVLEGVVPDKQCRIYVDERVSTGSVYRIDDPKNPKLVLVAKAPKMQNTPARGDPQMVTPTLLDMAFDKQGNLFISGSGLPSQDPQKPVGFVFRVPANKLDPANPGEAEVWATGTPGANGIAIAKNGDVYISGRNTIYRVRSTGGQGEVLKTGVNGTNNIAFNKDGTILWATSTANNAIWKIDIAPDGTVAGFSEWIRDPVKLISPDGIGVDVQGNLWVSSLSRNAIVAITPDKKIIDVVKNDNAGPLEAPTDLHWCGKTLYIGSADFERAPVDLDKNNLEPGNRPRQPGVGPNISTVPDVGIEGLPLPP